MNVTNAYDALMFRAGFRRSFAAVDVALRTRLGGTRCSVQSEGSEPAAPVLRIDLWRALHVVSGTGLVDHASWSLFVI